MTKYLFKKTVGWLLVVFLATNVSYFAAATFLDPRSNYAGQNPPLTPEQISGVLTPLNLDPSTPLLERWWTWLTGVLLHWDWGTSPLGGSVNAEVSHRIWVSAQLLLIATLLSVLIGVALGVYSASRQYRLGDRVTQGLSIITMNVHVVVASIAVVAVALWINKTTGTKVFYVTGAPELDGAGGGCSDSLNRSAPRPAHRVTGHHFLCRLPLDAALPAAGQSQR